MTAPNTGGGTQQLIQTILMIKDLQHKQAAEDLARQQFGLAKAATQEQMLGHVQTLASNLPDPTVLLPHVQSIAATTGLDPQVLQTMFSNAQPTEAVTKAGVVARGAKTAGSALEVPAAYTQIAGEKPGAFQLDALHNLIFQRANQYLTNLPEDQQRQFSAAVAQKVATGQTLGEALTDQIFTALPPEQQTQAIQIGKGLAPSADAVIQGRLGAGKLALDSHIAESESAYRQMQIAAAMAEAQSKLKGESQAKAIDILKAIQNQQQFLSNQSSNLTDTGQMQQNAALNALYKELNAIDPAIGSIFGDPSKGGTGNMPLGAFMTAPGMLPGLIQGFKNSGKKP